LRAGLSRAATASLKSTYFNALRAIATTPDGVAFLERVWRRREQIPGLPLAEPDEAALALELAVRAERSTNSPDVGSRPTNVGSGSPNAGSGFSRISAISRISAAPSLSSDAILEEQRGRFQNPDRKARFEFVMPALSADAAVRDAFFARLSDVSNRRREPWVIEGLQYLNHPLRAADSLKHLRPALDLLVDVQRTGDIFFPRNWMDAILSGHSSRDAVNIVRAFLDEHPDAEMLAAAAVEGQAASPARAAYPVRLRRIILQSADDLFRAPDIVIPGT
jgi:aminopeptidase N